MQRKVRVVVFDLMDTLVRDPVHDAVPRYFGTDLAGFFGAVDHRLYRSFEQGAVPCDAFYRGFRRDGAAIDRARFEAHLAAAYQWVDGMEAVLQRLHAEGAVAVAMISNYSCWYELVQDKLDVERYVEPGRVFVSYRTGLRKPAPESYLGVCKAMGVAPGECLLVDDRKGNCEAAEALGMKAHVFHSASDLLVRLATESVLLTTPTSVL